MAFYENCAERAVAVGLGCAWLATSGEVEAGVAVGVGLAGLASVVSDQMRKHGPESARALKAIRRKVADKLESKAIANGWDGLPEVRAADEALARALPGCFLNRSALAQSAVSSERFPAAATDLILAELARKESIFVVGVSPIALAFAAKVIHIALTAGIENKEYFAALEPHLLMEMLHAQGCLIDLVKAIPADTATAVIAQLKQQGFLAQAIDLGLTAHQVNGILAAFGKTGLPPEKWAQALLDSAAQLQELQTRFAAMPSDPETQITALVHEAGAAITSGDFSRADSLLAQAEQHDIDSGIARIRRAAETRFRRGELAQSLKDHWTAGEHFEAAARLVATHNPEYAAHCHDCAGIAFSHHGQLFPGASLDRAVTAYARALEVYTPNAMPANWARTQNNLGITLRIQGQRTGGNAGLTLLAQSATAFACALKVYTKNVTPADWAATQNNLGSTLGILGERTAGDAGLTLLAESAAAYARALEVHTQSTMPVEWAATQNNLSNTLRAQGELTGGDPGLALLAESTAACAHALEVSTQDAMPEAWATTQNNLGNTLLIRGTRSVGDAGRTLLAESAAAFSRALEVRTKNAMPTDWAMTQNNLGNTMRILGERTGGDAGLTLLEESARAFARALEVYTQDAMPAYWAMTQNNLGGALQIQGQRTGGDAGLMLLAKSAAAYALAMKVYTLNTMPAQWAMAQGNLAMVHLASFKILGDRAELAAARVTAEAAMTVYGMGGMELYREQCLQLLAKIAACETAS